MCLEFFRHHNVDRQHDFAPRRLGLGHDFARGAGKVGFGERLADLLSLREQESIGHRAADDQRIDFVEQIAEQIELG